MATSSPAKNVVSTDRIANAKFQPRIPRNAPETDVSANERT